MTRNKKEPRYIDANLAKEALIGWETDPTDDEIEYVIDNIPTADVAPRAEIAREIFEEIEKLLDKYYDEDERAYYPVPHYDLWLGDDIAELKKKYTEPEPPKGD